MRKDNSKESITIVAYQTRYKKAFHDLNKEWIDAYFKMEEADYKALDHPEEYIIDKGGFILVALINKEPIAVCAMIRMEGQRQDFELAKMAVAPQHHGKGIGYALGKAVLDEARKQNAKSIYLESNRILQPAIRLYKKLGFKEIIGYESPYDRSDIQMEYIY